MRRGAAGNSTTSLTGNTGTLQRGFHLPSVPEEMESDNKAKGSEVGSQTHPPGPAFQCCVHKSDLACEASRL